jgi:hypothetical protein
MKKFNIVTGFSILMILFGFNTLSAQDDYTYSSTDDETHGGFGIKGGLAISTIGFNFEDAETHKNRFRLGGTGGFGYETKSSGVFGFEIEALYDLRGTKEVYDLAGGNKVVQKNYLHYIQVPASFKFYIGNNFNINVGPYGAVLVGGKTKYTLFDINDEILESDSYKITGEEAQDGAGNDYLNKFDFGLQAGLEFVSDGGVGVGSKFSKGLADITNDDHLLGGKYASTTEISVYMFFRL